MLINYLKCRKRKCHFECLDLICMWFTISKGCHSLTANGHAPLTVGRATHLLTWMHTTLIHTCIKILTIEVIIIVINLPFLWHFNLSDPQIPCSWGPRLRLNLTRAWVISSFSFCSFTSHIMYSLTKLSKKSCHGSTGSRTFIATAILGDDHSRVTIIYLSLYCPRPLVEYFTTLLLLLFFIITLQHR